jgi:hypothetical protein
MDAASVEESRGAGQRFRPHRIPEVLLAEEPAEDPLMEEHRDYDRADAVKMPA